MTSASEGLVSVTLSHSVLSTVTAGCSTGAHAVLSRVTSTVSALPGARKYPRRR